MFMKKKLAILVRVSICLVASTHCSYAEEKLSIITCEAPPLSYTVKDKVSGPAVDIVRSIQKRLNTNEKIHVYPWSRGYSMLKDQPNVVLFSTTRTMKREKMFKWVGPIVERRFSFHAKKASKIEINNLEDAKEYHIGVVRNSNNEQFLISNGFKEIQRVTLEKQNLRKLLENRIDLWYTDTAQSSGLMANSSQEESIEEVFFVHKSRSYYAFNKKIPDSIVKRWQDTLDDLRKDGTILDILKKYKLVSLHPK